jgi:hypothetical protein
MTDPDWAALTAPLIELVLVPALMAFGTWLATKIPGPLRDFLGSAVHQRDVQLIVDAMARRALAMHVKGTSLSVAGPDLEGYVRRTLPGVVAKLRPSGEALKTMGAAALAKASADLAASRATSNPPM